MDTFCESESRDEAEVESRPPGPDPRLQLWIGGLEPTVGAAHTHPVGHNLPEPTCPSIVTHNYKTYSLSLKVLDFRIDFYSSINSIVAFQIQLNSSDSNQYTEYVTPDR